MTREEIAEARAAVDEIIRGHADIEDMEVFAFRCIDILPRALDHIEQLEAGADSDDGA